LRKFAELGAHDDGPSSITERIAINFQSCCSRYA
jgi:hypothetical protein